MISFDMSDERSLFSQTSFVGNQTTQSRLFCCIWRHRNNLELERQNRHVVSKKNISILFWSDVGDNRIRIVSLRNFGMHDDRIQQRVKRGHGKHMETMCARSGNKCDILQRHRERLPCNVNVSIFFNCDMTRLCRFHFRCVDKRVENKRVCVVCILFSERHFCDDWRNKDQPHAFRFCKCICVHGRYRFQD